MAYEPQGVFDPGGRLTTAFPIETSLSVADLNGRTVAHIWDFAFKGDRMFTFVSDELRRRFPQVRLIEHDLFGDHYRAADPEAADKALTEKLRDAGVDCVISSMGC
jgi:hypothetical protein